MSEQATPWLDKTLCSRYMLIYIYIQTLYPHIEEKSAYNRHTHRIDPFLCIKQGKIHNICIYLLDMRRAVHSPGTCCLQHQAASYRKVPRRSAIKFRRLQNMQYIKNEGEYIYIYIHSSNLLARICMCIQIEQGQFK